MNMIIPNTRVQQTWQRNSMDYSPVLYSFSHWYHYNDVIMGVMASEITILAIVYSTVYSGADQGKHQSSASLDLCDQWIPRTIDQQRGKCFHLMTSSWPWNHFPYKIDGLVQGRCNSSVLTMELRLSCTNPSNLCHSVCTNSMIFYTETWSYSYSKSYRINTTQQYAPVRPLELLNMMES